MSDKADEKYSYRKSLSALFASASALGFGALSLLNNMSMDYYSLLFMLSIVVPATCCMGFMGFVIGKIFDERGKLGVIIKVKKQKGTPKNENPYKIKSMFQEQDSMGEISMFDENENDEAIEE